MDSVGTRQNVPARGAHVRALVMTGGNVFFWEQLACYPQQQIKGHPEGHLVESEVPHLLLSLLMVSLRTFLVSYTGWLPGQLARGRSLTPVLLASPLRGHQLLPPCSCPGGVQRDSPGLSEVGALSPGLTGSVTVSLTDPSACSWA